MKTAKALTILLAVAVVTMGASARDFNSKYDSHSDSGKVNYMMALKSGNEGLMESALMHLMVLKIRAPQSDMMEAESTVNSLLVNSPEASTRYKASLALQVFADPRWFAEYVKGASDDVEGFYRNISVRLQQKYFAGVRSDANR
jgi:hypothetical protein